MNKLNSRYNKRAHFNHILLILLLFTCLATIGNVYASPLAGVWRIQGNDARLGTYSGLLELRQKDNGGFNVIRVVSLEQQRHHDGRAIDLVWSGTAQRLSDDAATIAVSLTRADFITEVGVLHRTPADAVPLTVTGEVQHHNGYLQIHYEAAEDSGFSVTERAWRRTPNAAHPLWQSARDERATHPDPATPYEPDPLLQFLLDNALPGLVLQKDAMFDYFSSFHTLPEVQPYIGHPEFQQAIHFQIVDQTDFDYYLEHPDRLRVINKVVDAISLAETEIRANAFRTSLIQKADFYQQGLSEEFVGAHGMVVRAITSAGEEVEETDSALWTGVYTYTQGIRYQATGQPEALENMRRSLTAILTLMDITGNPQTFARTLRLHQPSVSPPWYQGEGAFAHLDWLAGGNNDMAKGLLLAMIAGWNALPADDPLRAAIRAHAVALLQLDIFQPIDPFSVNPALAALLAGIVNNNPVLIANGIEWLRNPLLLLYPQYGGGPFYALGISDWSGNHLTLTTTLVLQWLLARTGDNELAALWTQAAVKAWEILRPLDHPLHAAFALSTGAVTDPAQYTAAREQAIWGLRSFPIPKHPHPVDHRIRADFVMSPIPNLPWKLDWMTDMGRQQSIRAWPLFEQGSDEYRWKEAHFGFRKNDLQDDMRAPGVDYLFLYWLARESGIIPPAQHCALLGNTPLPGMPDKDAYRFNGTVDEVIRVRLEPNRQGSYTGQSATLRLLDGITEQQLLAQDRSELPNEITARLPASGDYYIVVQEQRGSPLTSTFLGDYCVSLDSSRTVSKTLEPTYSVGLN